MTPRALIGWSIALAACALAATSCGSSGASSGALGSGTSSATSPQGSSSPGAAAPTSPPAATAADACSIITQQDAAAALGSDPGPGTARSASSASQCTYGRAAGGGTSLIVALAPGAGRGYFDDAKTKIEAAYQQQGGTVQDVPGVGDAAFVVAVAHGGAFVILKGAAVVSISLISPMSLNATADTLTTLGQAAGGRM